MDGGQFRRDVRTYFYNEERTWTWNCQWVEFFTLGKASHIFGKKICKTWDTHYRRIFLEELSSIPREKRGNGSGMLGDVLHWFLPISMFLKSEWKIEELQSLLLDFIEARILVHYDLSRYLVNSVLNFIHTNKETHTFFNFCKVFFDLQLPEPLLGGAIYDCRNSLFAKLYYDRYSNNLQSVRPWKQEYVFCPKNKETLTRLLEHVPNACFDWKSILFHASVCEDALVEYVIEMRKGQPFDSKDDNLPQSISLRDFELCVSKFGYWPIARERLASHLFRFESCDAHRLLKFCKRHECPITPELLKGNGYNITNSLMIAVFSHGYISTLRGKMSEDLWGDARYLRWSPRTHPYYKSDAQKVVESMLVVFRRHHLGPRDLIILLLRKILKKK